MFGAVGNDRLTETHPEIFQLFELCSGKVGMALGQKLHCVRHPLTLFIFDCFEYPALSNRKKQLIASDFEGRLWTVDLLLASLSRQHYLPGANGVHRFVVPHQPVKYNPLKARCKGRTVTLSPAA
jgi:hypothetical protein